MTTKTIDIGSFYWSLRGEDFFNHSTAWQGDNIFKGILDAGTRRGLKIRIAQSKPSSVSPNIDTEILVKRKAAEVRSVDFDRLVGGGVLHTKFWIVDDQHIYIGSANMDWRALTQVNIFFPSYLKMKKIILKKMKFPFSIYSSLKNTFSVYRHSQKELNFWFLFIVVGQRARRTGHELLLFGG